ncbi:MAG: hypothetical protein V2I46_01845 [Bacteroides sp.]|jgi:hypothetical protein|nr:hypothetical protein [Bacteroides sp.]
MLFHSPERISRSMLRLGLALSVFCLGAAPAFSQKSPAPTENPFLALEDSLHRMAMQIIEPTDDKARLEQNALFQKALEQALLMDSILANPFDSVRTVSFLTDPRGDFRIITWYVPLVDGTYQYFGFIQTSATRKQSGKLFPLHDKTNALTQVSSRQLGQDEWYGAWYYELIHQRHRRKDYYTLLGWKGDNPASRKRVIEPFHITEEGPVFGAQVFDGSERKPFRIIFEYSARVSMTLKYEPEFSQGKRRKVPMIVFDRLAPTHETFQGNFQYYVPEVNVLDGFRFQKGRWSLVPDVDARVSIDPALVPLNPPRNP